MQHTVCYTLHGQIRSNQPLGFISQFRTKVLTSILCPLNSRYFALKLPFNEDFVSSSSTTASFSDLCPHSMMMTSHFPLDFLLAL